MPLAQKKASSFLGKGAFSIEWENAKQRTAIGHGRIRTERTGMPDFCEEIASVQTDFMHAVVTEFDIFEPHTILVTPTRPTFTAWTTSSTDALISYGYHSESHLSGKVESVVFMAPGREVKASCTPGSFRSFTCSIDLDYAKHIHRGISELSPSQLTIALNVKNPLIINLLQRLMHEVLFPGPISGMVFDSLGNALLVEWSHGLLLDHTKVERRGSLTAKHMQIIEGYFTGLYSKAPDTSEMAKACGYSDRHFIKLFREQYGCTISKYIRFMQMSRAKVYLLESDLDPKEIAFRLGFSSLPNFYHAFREATGMTPAKFRKNG